LGLLQARIALLRDKNRNSGPKAAEAVGN